MTMTTSARRITGGVDTHLDVRHRLNRGGDRQANSALWHIVFTRMVNDPRTHHYIERRMKDGRTKKEAVAVSSAMWPGRYSQPSRAHNSPLTLHRSILLGHPTL
jgi:hypothetical protein